MTKRRKRCPVALTVHPHAPHRAQQLEHWPTGPQKDSERRLSGNSDCDPPPP
eukprot:CAMPEP_0202833760 /NCGR_PEP_ID=MMETSP1389-20130828/28370_1 /ASSEMBLY_ACC=CAM_ASM_000865 /TAXON_ID=302021 /ORGANISM="Rhodomonas sp., Strain CCMP768" /LENGTH=51 /DNA_ID=CAMNT_0049508631 /DNA_START=43 /DNA_END=195 /DNA_ORIENTATION=+